MIPYNIQPGTKVRNIKTGKEHVFSGFVRVTSPWGRSTLAAHIDGCRWMYAENFSRNYELANQAKPSLMTSIG